ncbi:MAG: YecA family protein [Pseudomonadota bacterium]
MKDFTDDDEQALMLLLDELAGDDTLDYAATHGLLCALVAGPEVADSDWLSTVFDGAPDFPEPGQGERCIELIRQLHGRLAQDFYGNGRVVLPCPLRPGHERLESWCIGFMEGVFLNEPAWLGDDADPEIAHLLLPVMVESDLIDMPETRELRKNRALRETMVRELPENLVDLYLLFHGGREGNDPPEGDV